MKITLLALVLVIAFSTNSLLGAASPAPEQVVDTTGKKVRSGVNYYIVPASNPYAGVAVTVSKINQTCPLNVVAGDYSNGPLPLHFLPVNEKKDVIRVNTDLNIHFTEMGDECPESPVWMLKDYDPSSDAETFVTLGGELGNPGKETLMDWFKIEKHEDAYKLFYCPNVYYESYGCSDIGISEDAFGNKRLALTNVPYKVRFQPA
ncbi:miraculin-like [Arachis duranensis]|uniref:Miraculin-like n=1 Tax=Arachis duranensis TaxID=130453 RepID=A0A6P4DCY6_ARADU|nr:miraculin-like [Arachis duranensis]